MGVALAFPQNQVLTRSEIRDDFNQFALSYSTDTGIAVAQQGALKTVQTPNGPINIPIQQGSYAFYTPEGKKITTYWVSSIYCQRINDFENFSLLIILIYLHCLIWGLPYRLLMNWVSSESTKFKTMHSFIVYINSILCDHYRFPSSRRSFTRGPRSSSSTNCRYLNHQCQKSSNEKHFCYFFKKIS